VVSGIGAADDRRVAARISGNREGVGLALSGITVSHSCRCGDTATSLHRYKRCYVTMPTTKLPTSQNVENYDIVDFTWPYPDPPPGTCKVCANRRLGDSQVVYYVG
jgi:hypothetical protein